MSMFIFYSFFFHLNIRIQYLTMLKHLNVCQLHSRLIYKINFISFSTLDLISHPAAVRLNGTTLSF